LVLPILGIPAGVFLGLFKIAVLGIFQGAVHIIVIVVRSTRHGLGAGFYSTIPLAIFGAITFFLLFNLILLMDSLTLLSVLITMWIVIHIE
jgi:hypothetical protein